MINKARYDLIRAKHGEYGSWAAWADSSGKPKSNMGVLSHFDDPDIVEQLKSNVVMVALNFSRTIAPVPFINFHDANPRAQDYKIRHAFKGTPFWGAYMTDVIKRHVDVESSQVVRHLKEHPEVVAKNLEILREELSDLGADRPVILAFGAESHRLLQVGLSPCEYSHLIKLTHYSHQIGQEEFKKQAFDKLASIRQFSNP
jgi:hypothetical protein